MSSRKSLRKIWPALVVACFGFSGLMASDAFAEVTDPVCKTLIAHADVEGEWSPAVTVCAGKADDGTTILMSMAGTSDYYRAGANTSGVASTARIDVDDNATPERGAVFYGDAGSGKITIGGLNFWDSRNSGGSFTASDGDYNGDPGKFVDAVLNGGRSQIGIGTLTRVRYVPSSGGVTIQNATCEKTTGMECDRGAMANYRNLIAAQGPGYSVDDCTWVVATSNGESTTYKLVCGAEPQHTYNITYTLETITESEDVAKAVAESVTNNGVQQGTSDNVKDLCYGMGVDDQGWFLCPSLSNMTYTASWIDNLIQEWLSVDPSLYDSGSSTYAVWTAMRDIANVLMIILLLVVIFSQLTGFGIDNYGIKKMLPRLITMAVLINLSFVICELAVDLSNILGVGLRDMFGAMGESLNSGQNVNGTDFISWVVTGILGLTTAGGAMAGTIIAGVMTGGVAGVLIVILALVAVIAAVLLFFVGLAARMVMVILCIAVAPVAFALFILPNTQGIFKKWWDIFKVALLMFPICGALGGISNLIKGMVRANQGDFMMLVIGLIAPFLAFFLLPSMLKGMVAMLGQIGGALQNMGQSLTGGIRNSAATIQNSEAFKDRAQYDRERTAANRAQRIRDRLESGAKNNTLSNRQWARYNRASERVATYQAGREKAFGAAFDRNDRSDNAAAFANSMAGTDAERASAAFTSLVGQGGTGEALDAAMSADWKNMDKNVESRLLQTMGASDIDALKTYVKYRQQGGGAGFGDWARGSVSAEQRANDVSRGVKTENLSYASHLERGGANAMNGYDKDQMKFATSLATDASGAMDPGSFGMDSKAFGAMLGNAAVNSKDVEAQIAAEKAIQQGLTNDSISLDDLGITADMIGSMREETAQAIWQGAVGNIASMQSSSSLSQHEIEHRARLMMNAAFANQAAEVSANSNTKNRTKQGVRDVFGVV